MNIACGDLNCSPLEHRLISDLITCYNIVHGHSSLKYSDSFKFSNSQITRGHEL